MIKKFFKLFGIAVALTVIITIAIGFKRKFDIREKNRIAVREYFDVRSKGLKPVKAFTSVKSILCRKATVEEIRNSTFAKNGDLVLDIVHADGAKTTLEISEMLRLESEYAKEYGGKGDVYIEVVLKRLNQFDVDFSFLQSSDCSDWEDGISQSISH